MSGLLALRLARGGQKHQVEILRALAYDNQTGNFTAGQLLTGIGVQASQTVDFGSNTLNGLTITVGSKTYTFQDTLTDVDGNVDVGANAEGSIDNLVAAVNLDAGAGTAYAASMTEHPEVTAVKVDADTIRFVAKEAGTAANALGVSETGSAMTVGGSNLAGGIDPSGATGRLVEQVDNGTSGTLQLRDVRGEFANNERIVDALTGAALVNGALAVPLLTPSDAMILQADAEDFTRAELADAVSLLRSKIIEMDWTPDNGLFALRVTRGALADDVEHLGVLAYDGQSGNFTEDLVVTGAGGASGRIVTDTDGGTSGTLLLADPRGDFVNDEALTDTSTGAAVANGVQSIPLLTPSDQLILQIDAVDYTKAEALEGLKQLELALLDMAWPAAA